MKKKIYKMLMMNRFHLYYHFPENWTLGRVQDIKQFRSPSVTAGT